MHKRSRIMPDTFVGGIGGGGKGKREVGMGEGGGSGRDRGRRGRERREEWFLVLDPWDQLMSHNHPYQYHLMH